MAKNPITAGSSTTTSTTSASGASHQDVEHPLATNVGGDPQTSASSDAVGNTPKLDVKTEAAAETELTTAAAETTTANATKTATITTATASESQAEANASANSSKVRKLKVSGGPSPQPEEPVLDIKCLLLADASLDCVPLHLRHLLEAFGADSSTLPPAELLLLLIYCVALECGYVTTSEWSRCSDRMPHLPPTSSFHSKNVARLSRLKPNYKIGDPGRTHLSMRLRSILRTSSQLDNDESRRLLDSLLTCLVSGDFLIVTLTPAAPAPTMPGRSVCLSIGRYVLSTAPPKGKPIHQRFRKLDDLSALLRDGLFVPIRNGQLDALGVGVYPSLLGLPAELYENVFRYLSRNQLRKVANVCRHLHYFSTHSRHYQ